MEPSYSAPFMEIQVSGPATVITMRGELDLCRAATLETCFRELEFVSVREVVLDLTLLDFIDVAGVRAVFALEAVCRRSATLLTIIPSRPPVHRIFQLTHTETRLPFKSRRQ